MNPVMGTRPSAVAVRVSPGTPFREQNWTLAPKPPLAARHQTFKNHPLFVNTHFRVVHLDAVGHKENDGSMEVEIAWTLLLTIC